jgi:hypothetical protein
LRQSRPRQKTPPIKRLPAKPKLPKQHNANRKTYFFNAIGHSLQIDDARTMSASHPTPEVSLYRCIATNRRAGSQADQSLGPRGSGVASAVGKEQSLYPRAAFDEGPSAETVPLCLAFSDRSERNDSDASCRSTPFQ